MGRDNKEKITVCNEDLPKLRKLENELEKAKAYAQNLEERIKKLEKLLYEYKQPPGKEIAIVIQKYGEYAYVSPIGAPSAIRAVPYVEAMKRDLDKLKLGDLVFISLIAERDGMKEVITSKCEDLKYHFKQGKIVEVKDNLAKIKVGPEDIVTKELDPQKYKLEVGDEVDLLPNYEIYQVRKAISPYERKPTEKVTYGDVGGLSEKLEKIRDTVELPLLYPDKFEKLGVPPSKGILLYGPPGCGKTWIAKAIANETKAKFYSINGPEVQSKWVGEPEERLREIFEDAKKNAPSIIFIDEIDVLAPRREELTSEVGKRVAAQLLACLDGLESRGEVIVIGATNRPMDLDPALKRPGRFDEEIYISPPDEKGREEILRIHTRNASISPSVDFRELADKTLGYVGADLAELVRRAGRIAVKRAIKSPRTEEQITKEDFENACKEVKPSGLREVGIEVEYPIVSGEDIGGLEKEMEEIKKRLFLPQYFPEHFPDEIRSTAILLHGPPGCGKTLLARWIASTSRYPCIRVSGPELLSKWVGESERGVRRIFELARLYHPCIILLDEFGALGASLDLYADTSGVRRGVVAQFATELEGLKANRDVYVIATTVDKNSIDPVLRRRFFQLEIPLPDENARKKIFEIYIKKCKLPLAEDVDLDLLARKTNGLSGGDIRDVCEDVVYTFYSKKKYEGLVEERIGRRYFEDAVGKIRQKAKESTFTPIEFPKRREAERLVA